jgi:hypothetical protein
MERVDEIGVRASHVRRPVKDAPSECSKRGFEPTHSL